MGNILPASSCRSPCGHSWGGGQHGGPSAGYSSVPAGTPPCACGTGPARREIKCEKGSTSQNLPAAKAPRSLPISIRTHFPGVKALHSHLPMGASWRKGEGTHQLKLLPELGDDHTRVSRVLSHAHELCQGQLLPAVLLQGFSLELREAPVLGPVGLGRVGLLRHLRCGRLLVLPGLPFCKGWGTKLSCLCEMSGACFCTETLLPNPRESWQDEKK